MTRESGTQEFLPFSSAFMVSLFLHIVFIVLITGLYAFGYIRPEKEQKPENEEPAMKISHFTFVDLPRELPEPEEPPDTDVFSDRDRVAGSRSPLTAEEEALDTPYGAGETDLFTAREPDPRQDMESIPVEQAASVPGETADPSIRTPLEEEADETVSLTENGGYLTEEQRRRLQESIENSIESYKPPENGGYDSQPQYDNQESTLFTEDSMLSFETKWFDWGPYANDLYWIIRRNWRIPMAARWPLLMKGRAVVRFTLRKDGSVEGVELLRDSGIPSFDDAAIYAIKLSDPFPPMPENFPGEKERITCSFYYNMRIGDGD